jgi:dTDP-glucose 4,6-dehydratase
MKKVLLTGGAGFIGSALIRHVISDCQASVVNVHKLTYAGNLESISSVASAPGYAFEQVDICDRFAETAPYAPSSPYSATKAGSDHLVRA